MRSAKLAAQNPIGTCGVSVKRERHSLSLPGRLLYGAARWAQRRSTIHTDADLARTTDEQSYRTWRRRELEQQLAGNFSTNFVQGRDVVDFGCGTGELSKLLATFEPRSLLGVDKSSEAIRRAEDLVIEGRQPGQTPPKFACNEAGDRLPVDSGSVDLVCCFDVVEHIAEPASIAQEWRRILRPDGRVWIWWSPWRGPHGHHLESLIPLPWIHLLMPEKVIFEACAELYDAPDFVTRKWDRDPVSGMKKPNKWRKTQSFYPFLNKLTRRRFEKTVQDAGLTWTRREIHGFCGSRIRRATRLLLPVPMLGDAFVSHYIYELAPTPAR